MMERVLKLKAVAAFIDVPVIIAEPRREAKSWTCRWEIRWPDRVRSNSAGGIDALQAMLHAMQMVGIELYTSEEHRAGLLKWTDIGEGYGFPLTGGCRDLLEGDDAKYL